MSRGQQAVQGGHAVAEYMLQKPNKWKNTTLIYLLSKNIEFDFWKLNKEGYECIPFKEPDLNNKITAFGICVKKEDVFKKYQLLKN